MGLPRVAILTALVVEYDAVCDHLQDTYTERHSQEKIYSWGIFVTNKQVWEVFVTKTGTGNAEAALEAKQAIDLFNPDIVLFVGIAGGIKHDIVAIGDVVAAEKIYNYESGKEAKKYEDRRKIVMSSEALVQISQQEKTKKDWLERLPNIPSSPPKVFVDVIASGEKVVASRQSDTFRFLTENYKDAIAVEMEGFGVLTAAHNYPNIEAIVIRGISDLVEGKNDDSVEPEQLRQKRASLHASAFAFEILAKHQITHSRQTSEDSPLELSKLQDLAKKFKDAPENITDPVWQDWFNEVFVLQFDVLKDISVKVGKLLKAHRTTVYFVGESEKDKDKKELWSIFAQEDTEKSPSLEIRIPFGEGISGRVAESKEASFVPYDAHQQENSEAIKNQDARTGYRTYTLMTLPLLNDQGELVAVFQFVNKLSINKESNLTRYPRKLTESDVDKSGFNYKDKFEFEKYIVKIRPTVDLYQHYYNLSKKWESIVKFSSATLTLNKEGQDLESILKTIINEAKKITDADRVTFWLLDRNNQTLEAKILNHDGSYELKTIKVGEGFAGKVAKEIVESKSTKSKLNIPYDLYDHPESETSKIFDQKTGYRTCSLLCMPVINTNGDLIGVTQLINKRRRQSQYQEYCFEKYPDSRVPEFFKASFSIEDEERLAKFNQQVAAAIQNAQRSVMVDQYHNLYNLLNITAQVASRYFNAHRARIFLVDEETKFGHDKTPKELWSIIAEDKKPCEISVPIGAEKYQDIDLAGQVAKEYIDSAQNIAEGTIFKSENYFSDEPLIDYYFQSFTDQGEDIKYIIYNRLILPLSKKTEESNNLIAVIEFINKLKPGISQDNALSEDIIDPQGFSKDDKKSLGYGDTESLTHLIEGFLDIYKPVKQYLDSEKLMRAREFIFQVNSGNEISSENRIKMIEEKVKDAAKRIVNAHRCTLWRVDPKNKTILFADIPDDKGNYTKQQVTIGEGYVGDAAQRAIQKIQARKIEEKALKINIQEQNKSSRNFLNIPFDVYSHERNNIAKETDRITGYRTCSILCMPILSSDGNELLGVIQLINKVRRGFEKIANTAGSLFENKQIPPYYFMASFTKRDERQIASFNDAVGDILQFLSAPSEISQLTEAYLEMYSVVVENQN